MATNLRIPPQNLDAEKALLGSIMLRSDAINDINDSINDRVFYSEKHRIVFRAMMELFVKNTPIDMLTLTTRLRENNQLDQIGGASYIAELANAVPSSANIVHYGQTVKNKFMMRQLIDASEFISGLGYDESAEINELLDKAEKRVFEVTSFDNGHKVVEIKDTLNEAWERFDKLSQNKGELRGVPTGFRELDNKLSGFQESDLIILAARPSMGKTSLALDFARKTAINHNTPVAIFSLEMSAQSLVDRMLSAESQIDSWSLRNGKIAAEEDFVKLRGAMDRLSRAPIFIDDQAGNNILKMRSVARRLKKDKGLGLIIVDYLQLMTPTQTKGSDNLVQQTTEISRSLKQLAKELKVPVIALSQLSRAVEQRGGEPRLSDLRDSGCLAGDTLITRADTGERVTIKSLVGQKNIAVFSLNKENKVQIKHITKVFLSGVKKLFELKTRSGRTIKASANHPFMTVAGWHRLDELTPHTHIALPRQLDTVTGLAPVAGLILSQHELILLAHLLGDGCVLPRQPIHYTSADPANLTVVGEAAKALFDINARLVKQENWWHSYLPSPYHLGHGKKHPITLWYRKLGIASERSYKKVIPKAIFQSSILDIALFLKHLWATDGNISFTNLAGRKLAGAIYYASTSKTLAEQVQHLLLRLGILSTLREVAQHRAGKTYRPNYHVSVQGSIMQIRFLELVGCHGKRGEIIPDMLVALRQIEANPNTDIIPKDIWHSYIKQAKLEADISWRGVSEKMEVSYNGTALFKAGLSRARLMKIADILTSQSLASLAQSDIFWDEIVEVTPLGEEEVFDATVPGTHNFVANDIIVHNSIEQDADIVLFIHREDKYNKESGRPNIAKIMIEKHRNGPTGVVELYFDDKKTTFQSIEKSDFGEFGAALGGGEF